MNTASVLGGESINASVVVTGVEQFGSVNVPLSSSDTSVATVPSRVTVRADFTGSGTATFAVMTTQHYRVAKTVTITAGQGADAKTATLTVNPIAVMSLTFNPASVKGGTEVTGTVVLNARAPTGGLWLRLESDIPSAAVPNQVTRRVGNSYHVERSVTVPALSKTASFKITTFPVAYQTAVTITAGEGASAKSAALTVLPPTLVSITLIREYVVGGNSVGGFVRFDSPAPKGFIVPVTSSNPAVASIPTHAEVQQAGRSSAPFMVNTQPVSANTQVAIKATRDAVDMTTTLTVRKE